MLECYNGKCVYYNEGSDIEKAKEAAKKAEVAIVFVSTNSGEGSDRKSLSLDGN